MPNFTTLTSRIVPLLINDIDTDQIIPARFLKTTDKHGLGEALFCDWRYASDGSPDPDFVLNRPEVQGAQILLAGDNFGCGSSREHAPWALLGWGLQAVISTSFADIFRNNALKNGLLPVVVKASTHQALVKQVQDDPLMEVTIDLQAERLDHAGGAASFPIDAFSKRCLLEGIDQIGYLLSFEASIQSYEARHG